MRNILAYILLLGLFACDKDQVGSLDCINLKAGIAEQSNDIVRAEIEKLTPDLNPVPTPEDKIGHMANLQTLTDRINSDCEEITASIQCYACIETYPPLSEILVEFVFDGTQITAVIDIVTSDNDILRFGGMHQF